MLHKERRRACQGTGGLSGVAADDMIEVSVEFRHSFLKDGAPHGLVFSDVREEGIVLQLVSENVLSRLKW